MPNQLCPSSVKCLPCPDDSPVLNLSAEAPDEPVWVAVFVYPNPHPLGEPFGAKGCLGWEYSTVSQADADALAAVQTCEDPDPVIPEPDPDPDPDPDPSDPLILVWNAIWAQQGDVPDEDPNNPSSWPDPLDPLSTYDVSTQIPTAELYADADGFSLEDIVLWAELPSVPVGHTYQIISVVTYPSPDSSIIGTKSNNNGDPFNPTTTWAIDAGVDVDNGNGTHTTTFTHTVIVPASTSGLFAEFGLRHVSLNGVTSSTITITVTRT